jgi:HSP20 family protein
MIVDFGNRNAHSLTSDSVFVSTTAPVADYEWKETTEEGQLSVDVLETDEKLIIIATMAGTKPEDVSVHLHNDFLTIRGRRSSPIQTQAHYFYEECFWGGFSRTIVLPVEVKNDSAESEYKNGVLTITLYKARTLHTIPIMVIEE